MGMDMDMEGDEDGDDITLCASRLECRVYS